jgi:hypothetical protein
MLRTRLALHFIRIPPRFHVFYIPHAERVLMKRRRLAFLPFLHAQFRARMTNYLRNYYTPFHLMYNFSFIPGMKRNLYMHTLYFNFPC